MGKSAQSIKVQIKDTSVDKNIDNIFKICIIIFLVWIGYCAFQLSKNGRYQTTSSAGVSIDSQTGDLHRAKIIKSKSK